jgi:anti-sigma factor RsiW
MTMHEDVSERLSEYLDEELSGDERQVVDGHLAECEECRRTLDDLRRIVSTARTLPPVEPQGDLWRGIADRIAVGPRAVARPARRFVFTLPQLAAASVLLAVLSGWFAITLSHRRGQAPEPSAAAGGAQSGGGQAAADIVPVNLEDPQYDAAVKELQQTLDRGRDKLDPATVAAVEQDLNIIDAAVADARRALEADPSNGYLSGYIVETRQRKLALLRQAAALTQDVM